MTQSERQLPLAPSGQEQKMTLLEEHIEPHGTADGPSGHDAPPPEATPQTPDRPARRWGRRRVALLVLLALLIPTGWSYAGYLTAPGDAPVSVRSVDWLREHGFESVVDNIEQWYYTRSKPTGKTIPKNDLPKALQPATASPTASRAATVSGAAAQANPPIPTIVTPALPGEGVWTPVGGLAVNKSKVDQTFLRPDPALPSVAVNLVRLDQTATRLVYVPGTKEPGGTGWAWNSQIPVDKRQNVIAAFNAGFKLKNYTGGVYTEGRHAIRPLENGLAAVVINKNGTADIAQWGRDATMGPDIASVRQNLHLIVDNGRPVDGLLSNRQAKWGNTKSQLQFTWRSGIGIDAQGRLIYAVSHKMTLTQLATSLAQAGAVRAMQLDIHDGVITFNWYRPVAGTSTEVTGAKLIPAMPRAATRYLAPDQRDFFAVEAR